MLYDVDKSRRYVECVFHMLHADALPCDQDPDHIEPIGLRLPPVPVDPDLGALGQFTLFSAVDRLDRVPEFGALAGLHLDEGHHPVALRDEVDVAPPVHEAMIDDPPSPLGEPPGGNPFSECAEALVVCAHGPKMRCRHRIASPDGGTSHPFIAALRSGPDAIPSDPVEILEPDQHIAGLGSIRRPEDPRQLELVDQSRGPPVPDLEPAL